MGPEKDPDRETLMAVLSTAMVGPMDGYGLLNKTRIMTTCRKDGLVLKPDRPCVVSDSCFLEKERTNLGLPEPSSCFVYYTWSDLRSSSSTHQYRVRYHYNDANTRLTPAMVKVNETIGSYAV